jgi:lactoylglutathione lyase
MRIKHIAIRVKDLEKSIEFYETMTELKVLRRFKGRPREVAFLADA